jgi:VIT1/CCC1 family predicted Fe2+/Mn2+ transporter
MTAAMRKARFRVAVYRASDGGFGGPRTPTRREVAASNKLALAGLFFLAVSIGAVVLLVTDYIFDRATAVVTTACVGALFLATWYALAFWIRTRR